MASEVVYAEMPPKERAHFASGTSDAGDGITYAEVKVKWRSDTPDSPSKITHSAVTCLKNSHWCYVVFALVFTAVVLLITVILLAVKCPSLSGGH